MERPLQEVACRLPFVVLTCSPLSDMPPATFAGTRRCGESRLSLVGVQGGCKGWHPLTSPVTVPRRHSGFFDSRKYRSETSQNDRTGEGSKPDRK